MHARRYRLARFLVPKGEGHFLEHALQRMVLGQQFGRHLLARPNRVDLPLIRNETHFQSDRHRVLDLARRVDHDRPYIRCVAVDLVFGISPNNLGDRELAHRCDIGPAVVSHSHEVRGEEAIHRVLVLALDRRRPLGRSQSHLRQFMIGVRHCDRGKKRANDRKFQHFALHGSSMAIGVETSSPQGAAGFCCPIRPRSLSAGRKRQPIHCLGWSRPRPSGPRPCPASAGISISR